MKRKRSKIILLCCLIIVGVVIGLTLKKKENKTGLSIYKWNNFYESKNINLYYGSSEKQMLKELKEKYKIEKITNNSKDDFEKGIKIMNWIKENMEYDKKAKNDITNKGSFDILEDKENETQYSNIDICTVYNEFAITAGIISRIGELTESEDEKSSIYICEIWSKKYNKWIMIDPCNGVYMMEKAIPLSVIQIIEKGIDNVEIKEIEKNKKYKKDIGKYFYTYVINIDNTIYEMKNSNCYISFSKSSNENTIPVKVAVKHPTIFTKSNYLFNLSPDYKYKASNKKEMPTLIFSKGNISKTDNKTKDDNKIKMHLLGGVFENSSMLDIYYISINNAPFKKENKYFEVDIKKGINSIKLSKDGKNVIREVVFQYKE